MKDSTIAQIAALIVCLCVVLVGTTMWYFFGGDALLYVILGGILYASVLSSLK